jgi:hypothetical protein
VLLVVVPLLGNGEGISLKNMTPLPAVALQARPLKAA